MNRAFQRAVRQGSKRLVSFHFADRVLANSVLLNGLSDSEANLAFDLLNKDGTTLTIKEISRLFGPEDSSSARAMEMFLAGVVRDSEHDGEINEELTRDEFKGLVCTEGTQMSSALEMFTAYNGANKSQREITMSQLKAWFFKHGKVLSDNDLSKIFEGVDTNGDHVIDYDEFIILVTKKIILNAVENKYQ